MPQIHLGFSVPAVVVGLLIIAAGAAAVLFYRYTVPKVSPRRHAVLAALRTAALAAILLLICEPVLRLVFTTSQKPIVAVLIDNSRSMRIVDKSGDRTSTLRSALGAPAFSAIGRQGELRYYTFGTRLTPSATAGGDSLPLNDDGTDISAALGSLAKERERGNLTGAILLTDGSYNLGPNPVHTAGEPGIPLFTVGIGDSSEQKDLLVSRVNANELVYSDAEAPVDVTVKSAGFGGERTQVILSEGGTELDRKTITLEEGTREYSVQLSYVPRGEGVKKYTVSVSSLPGELTETNNRMSFHARVLRSKLRVTVVAGAPSPDLTVVRQTLIEEKNFAVRAFTVKLPAGFYEAALTQDILDSSDCLVMIGIPASSTPPALTAMLARTLETRRTPLLYISGQSVDYSRLREIEPFLPFTVSPLPSAEQLVYLAPAPAERGNALLSLGLDEGADAWTRLPPIMKSLATFKSKPDALVLGFCRVQNVTTPQPLLLSRTRNRSKVIAIAGYAVWRWRLMAQGDPTTEGLFSAFLTASVKWLSTTEENRPVKVTAAHDMVPLGQPVEFTGQVYDASARPVEESRLHLVARQGQQRFDTELRPIGGGRYEGSLEGLPLGEYTFQVTAEANGAVLGEDNGRFSVGGLEIEFQETRMNAPLLRQLATRTGGRFFLPSSMDSLADAVTSQATFTVRHMERTEEIELWNWRYALGAIIFLLALEWFLRKRSGML